MRACQREILSKAMIQTHLFIGIHNPNHAAALLCALLLPFSFSLFAVEASVNSIAVQTRTPNNPTVKFWYRVPSSYDPFRRERHRVLVLFGGRNCDGRPEVSGKLGWTAWADLNGVILVSPTLKDDAYWEPEAWSGRALLSALDALAAKFRIATRGILFYGYSAGSQASNLFPAWRPDLCRAYVSHACGVFHKPSARMRGVAGLVTCGDADTARYVLSRQFVDDCRALGVPVVWKSFPNRPHDVPEESLRLAREFLAHHHWSHPEDLGGVPALVSCGVEDADRFAIGRTFACRYREAGGLLVWKPTRGGHELGAGALALAREFFAAIADGASCALWGEDDTRLLAPREDIDGEYLNPLYNARVVDLWRKDAP